MIEPQSAQLGASAWVWKLTFVAPRFSVIGAAAAPFPFPIPVAGMSVCMPIRSYDRELFLRRARL